MSSLVTLFALGEATKYLTTVCDRLKMELNDVGSCGMTSRWLKTRQSLFRRLEHLSTEEKEEGRGHSRSFKQPSKRRQRVRRLMWVETLNPSIP